MRILTENEFFYLIVKENNYYFEELNIAFRNNYSILINGNNIHIGFRNSSKGYVYMVIRAILEKYFNNNVGVHITLDEYVNISKFIDKEDLQLETIKQFVAKIKILLKKNEDNRLVISFVVVDIKANEKIK